MRLLKKDPKERLGCTVDGMGSDGQVLLPCNILLTRTVFVIVIAISIIIIIITIVTIITIIIIIIIVIIVMNIRR